MKARLRGPDESSPDGLPPGNAEETARRASPADDSATRETSLAELSVQAAPITGMITMHAEDERTDSATHNYDLVERISDGGQATVFKARARDTNELVALKIFKTSEEDPLSMQRFRREAQILSGLTHPHVVAYKGVFTAEGEWGEARQCLVMEFLEGISLKEYIRQHTQGGPWAETSGIFRQCLDALIYAHDERNIIHRDIKPSNIHIAADGCVKLIDFGIARLGAGGTHTGGSGLLGSFDYMSPDFARVKDAEFRGDEISDIFSLFVCFYEMITGRLPYAKFGERQELDYLQRWHGEVALPSTEPVVFRVITHLSRFIQKGLAPDREQRYQRLADVLQDFNALKPRAIVHENHERYVLTDALGSGGFSEVYQARRDSDGATVAIKRLFANRSLDRFIKEAEMLSLHPHPNVVQYHDFFETKSSSGRTDSFLVMEYLTGMPGWSLRERIKEHPDGLPVDEMLETFGCYLATLAYLYCHEHSVVHRDIKPANLYAPEGQPANAKLLDFGGARDVSGTKTTGSLPGTWDYMAPEFVSEGSRGTHQSDLYALGLSLYEALTGKPAYPRLPKSERDALNEFLSRARGDSKLQIRFDHTVFEQHSKLVDVIKRATARQPKARYADALQMRQDLDKTLKSDFGRNLPPAEELAPPTPANVASPSRSATRLINPFRIAHAKRRRKSLARVARFAVLLAILGLLLWVGWLRRNELTSTFFALRNRVIAEFHPSLVETPQSIAPETATPPQSEAASPSAQETPPPIAAAVPTASPAPASPPPPIQPTISSKEERQRNLLRELQLTLEPLTYFVAAGSKYDAIRAEIVKSAGTLHKTTTSPKYASVASDPSVRETESAIWRGILNEVMTILREQNDLSLLPLARGCVYVLFRLRPADESHRSYQTRYAREIADAQKSFPDLHIENYLPIPRMEVFRCSTGKDGAWLTNPFLDDVFGRPESQDVRARLLPHVATLDLSARGSTGPVTRKMALSFALVPDGGSGAGPSLDPFYMATVETPLEAIRCYRDDAGRWDPARKKLFSGVVSGKTLGLNDQPFSQARPEEAMEFCNWVSALAGLPPAYRKNDAGRWVVDLRQPGFRLPTNTEWEYAARYGFDFHRKPGAQTWEEMRKGLQTNPLVHYYFKREPRVSGSAAPYPLGLYDLCGNVEEICMAGAVSTTDSGESYEPRFVLKGGSAKSRTDLEVIPSYEAKTIDATHEFVGFRMVCPAPIECF
jgi:serine/threonine protein kinase